MEKKIQLVSDRLKSLEGLPLLDKDGLIYLLKGHTVKTGLLKDWFWPLSSKTTEYEYIDTITLSTAIVDIYEQGEFKAVLNRTNHIIADRNRYLKMLRCLSQLGYTIKRK